LSALPEMVEGSLIADVVAVIGSIDIVLGDVDR
jgi:NADH-quinone oxidoreductase subunit D